jgi:transcription elongation factor GreA
MANRLTLHYKTYIIVGIVSLCIKREMVAQAGRIPEGGLRALNKEIVMTKSGYAAVEAELEQLKTVKRKEVAEKIKVARGYGDLSENSEYDEAKNEQGMLESRIAELEKMLKHARVLDSTEIDSSVVSVGSHVKIQDEDGDTDEYDITGSTEADPLNGRISDESPVGAALLGHSAGDKVEITLPTGAVVMYEVLEVGRADI